MEGSDFGPKGKRHYNQLLACSCSFDSQRFVTAGDDFHIRVYDLNENACVRVLSSSFTSERMDGHVMRICAVKYHPRGAYQEDYSHIFISGSWDDTVQVWDDRFVHSLWVYGGPHISGSDALDIEPTSNTILTSSWRHDSTILQASTNIWKFSDKIIPRMRYSVEVGNTRFTTEYDVTEMNEAMNERPIEEVPQSSFEVRSKGYVARWIGAHYIAFGGSEANTLRIMTRNKPKPVAAITELPNGVFSLAYLTTPTEDSKNSIQLAIASGSSVYLARI
ncbi:WD domain, G-beta repeat protein [Opisthorchis viverrini]|nr:WD domain, G-beta repeat protein [Opisthorchis viverrini]